MHAHRLARVALPQPVILTPRIDRLFNVAAASSVRGSDTTIEFLQLSLVHSMEIFVTNRSS